MKKKNKKKNPAEVDLQNQIKNTLKGLRDNGKVDNLKQIHGPYEFGVDILFEYIDAFGQGRVYGVQVKIGDIDNKVLKDLIYQA
ncbi:hypothetical protein BVX98_02150 [bacterium F11]|nr:hypothetical protein BVX98_02150 [bacterium F11]